MIAARKILPTIAATITQHPRQLVKAGEDFDWNSGSLVHNCFRAFELVFGRRHGIRVEARVDATMGTEGVVHITREFYTIEAALAYGESCLRSAFEWKFVPVRVHIPMLATPFGAIPASPYLFAIAYDNAASGDGGALVNSLTFSFTTTGSNLSMTAGSTIGNGTSAGNTTDSVTYNAVGMTKFSGNSTLNSDNRYNGTLWWQAAPSTGAHNVVVTPHFTSSQVTCGAISMTGTSATPNGGTNTATGSSTAPSVSTTTTTANSFVVDCLSLNDIIANQNPTTTGTNQTMRYRQNENNGGHSNSGSTQVTTTAGSYTQSWSISPSGAWGMIAGEIIPVVVASLIAPLFVLQAVKRSNYY